MIRNLILQYLLPISVLFGISSLTDYLFFSERLYQPVISAWILATANFIAALWSLTLAQKTNFTSSILLVFAGGGIRMIIMISAVVMVMLKKSEWMYPFCTVLLECFVLYLIIEVAFIHKRGLLQN